MSGKFKKGQHLFFLMSGDETQQDSQNKPRYYLNRDRARQYAKGDSEIVEYAPVKYGQWKYKRTTGDGFAIVECTECGEEAFAIAYFVKEKDYCPNCGAKMGDGNE